MSITLHWWTLPICLALMTVFWLWRGTKATGGGMLNGFGELLIAIGFFIAAVVSALTGWIAS